MRKLYNRRKLTTFCFITNMDNHSWSLVSVT